MVEIISTEEYNGIEEKILDNMFPKLESLELDILTNLETFCSSPTYLKFSCLNSLIIKDCTKLGPFILDHMSKSIRDAAVHYLFDEKVGFPGLEKLVIKGLHKLTTLWHTQLDPNSFCRLTEIFVEDCENLIHVLVPRILKRLGSSVKVLNIRNCDSLEAVFNVKETDDALLLPQSAVIFSCRNLCEVQIVNCRCLKNVFPASVARNRNLEKLQKLWIKNCKMLEQIVGEEVGVEVEAIMPKFVFPSAKMVLLINLPQLNSFYPGMHTSKWPSVIELVLFNCDKLEMLAAESSCYQRQHHQLGMPTYNQVFFLYEKDSFSNLEILGLDIKETLYGSLPVVDFFKIKQLFIRCQRITSAVPPSVLFRKCHNLETLGMFYGNFEEIFIHEGSLGGEEHLGWTLTRLKYLDITGMNKLKHVGKDKSHLAAPVFPNLETLTVDDCPRLKNIVSPAISFHNIVELQVTNCDGMKHLITYSVAKSLINLEKMTVENCRRMIEIVASDDDQGDIIDGENEITFSRLEYMELSDLPNLKGFCSRNYHVRFPFFMTISVSRCIQMKISFDGVLLDDSKRERVQIIEEDDDDDDNNDGDDYDDDDDDDNNDGDDYDDDDDDSRHGGGGDDQNNDNEDDDDNIYNV
ncbi:uncharacterized protein LOC132799284 isoform X1 [Ziziphus jujuba]|uniref:Uncharacterized protein LOC132799284 isoform X1 n=1 Tax=Ziziphus jujuba TaxID=326968 RepID=A0ABM4ABX1_ZIZJJ|nr:uncharacterized protein LOC132799284 isoform X1 [Ziziphus jujuba]